MLKKETTRLEKEWKNRELGEMQEDSSKTESHDDEQDEGYDLSGISDTVYE